MEAGLDLFPALLLSFLKQMHQHNRVEPTDQHE